MLRRPPTERWRPSALHPRPGRPTRPHPLSERDRPVFLARPNICGTVVCVNPAALRRTAPGVLRRRLVGSRVGRAQAARTIERMLTPRQELILRKVVLAYQTTVQPVASRTLA